MIIDRQCTTFAPFQSSVCYPSDPKFKVLHSDLPSSLAGGNSVPSLTTPSSLRLTVSLLPSLSPLLVPHSVAARMNATSATSPGTMAIGSNTMCVDVCGSICCSMTAIVWVSLLSTMRLRYAHVGKGLLHEVNPSGRPPKMFREETITIPAYHNLEQNPLRRV
eukprot:Gregarina_sp_Pseudo_9__230@NODE_1149_length_1836_cov_49_388982_g1075_i0_p2_GENE_NODE_1149_length_1836_cov_49_388982_g1075_i0NODE_1149_length_1836_cov_49_388982_g1075_i0_p2_ORF_typecomplete_len163_score4_29_NODE_1149_length_1836_cov_49_388982_g1075_i010621550